MIHTHGQDAFLVKFHHSHALTICQIKELKKVSLEYDPENRGIEYIKRFNPGKARFERCKKSTIKMLVDYYTEVYIFLQERNYFN